MKNTFAVFFAMLVLADLLVDRRCFAEEAIPTEKIQFWKTDRTLLRGVNIWQKALTKNGGTEYREMESKYSRENLRRLQSWHVNFVNISHPGVYTEKTTGNPPRYQLVKGIYDNLRWLITVCRENRAFVVISFRTGPGRNEKVFDPRNEENEKKVKSKEKEIGSTLFQFDAKGNLTEEAKAAQSAWVEMWEFTAGAFKDDPLVLGYQPMVEPVTNWECEEADAANVDRARKSWYALAKRIAVAIRKIDANTPILIGPARYSPADELQFVDLELFRGLENLVFNLSQYAPTDYVQQDVKKRVKYSAKYREDLEAAYAAMKAFARKSNRPISIGEYGLPRWAGLRGFPDGHLFLRDQYDLMESGKYNHAIWLWEVDGLDYDDYDFQQGNLRTSIPRPNDPLIHQIKENWSRNTLFATPYVLKTLNDKFKKTPR
jgi:hypothetical protein